MTALIQIHNLRKEFGSEVAVDNVSLDIYDKEFLALLGPSGCGKTTLLRMLGGFENPSAGTIMMDGRDLTVLPPNQRPLNMVFQSYAVFPHMDVRDNIAYGLKMDRASKEDIQQRVDEALSLVRLEEYAQRYTHQLSGGQRQRVALARALVKRPRLLLLDEPLSALDAKLREAMQSELVKLHQTVGITFVVVTHDQDEALSMAQRIAVMEKGSIRQLDTPRNLYETPASRFVADFIGRMNILSARHKSGGLYEVSGLGDITATDENPNAQYIAIRPAYMNIYPLDTPPVGNTVNVTVANILYYGGETALEVKTENGIMLAVVLPNQKRYAALPEIGQKVNLCWRPEDTITLNQ